MLCGPREIGMAIDMGPHRLSVAGGGYGSGAIGIWRTPSVLFCFFVEINSYGRDAFTEANT